jgi:hypothetical protein
VTSVDFVSALRPHAEGHLNPSSRGPFESLTSRKVPGGGTCVRTHARQYASQVQSGTYVSLVSSVIL